MIGYRLPDIDNPNNVPLLLPGQYVRVTNPKDGKIYWPCCSPNDLQGDIAKHTIIEHEDGTITATPSIRITKYDGSEWHGYLTNGIWKEVQ